MKNLSTVMLWEEAEAYFIENHLPIIRVLERRNGYEHGSIDGPRRREAWNNWTDMLCKSGEISDWQYENWSQPECCEREVSFYRVSRHERSLY
jgi:hypothetical protein